LVTSIATSSLLAQSGESLFTNYCAGCHHSVVGVNESGGEQTNVYEAPYAKTVIEKLKTETKTKEAFVAFVKDYIDEPTKRKSLYGKKAIKNFGLMPSLKGAMSDEESTKLAEYMYSDYNKKKIAEKIVPSKTTETLTPSEKANESLFAKHCASCHTTVVGVDESGGKLTNVYDAPYAKDVMSKLKDETKTKEAFIAFLKDYIDTPDKRKSLYGKKAIKDFGLMPSLKGVMTDEESTGLADYLYEKYTD
ncbi:cytochrome c, partial [Sulfurovum sp. bin170]|uniref:c-type cytochrome n=1 Tax=Sulfurovum sp. bin170 TaxID=2695268 RepID=UPI0013DE8A24